MLILVNVFALLSAILFYMKLITPLTFPHEFCFVDHHDGCILDMASVYDIQKIKNISKILFI
jgi:hypothetical protein